MWHKLTALLFVWCTQCYSQIIHSVTNDQLINNIHSYDILGIGDTTDTILNATDTASNIFAYEIQQPISVITNLGECRGISYQEIGITRFCTNPLQPITIQYNIVNTGRSTWYKQSTALRVSDDNINQLFSVQSDTLMHNVVVEPNQIATYTIILLSPSNITGTFNIPVVLATSDELYGINDNIYVDVTCSDQVFCNGIERMVNGVCVSSMPSCNDNLSCTADFCDELHGTCQYSILNTTECAPCLGSYCVGHCDTGAECGSDGCGGTCGMHTK